MTQRTRNNVGVEEIELCSGAAKSPRDAFLLPMAVR